MLAWTVEPDAPGRLTLRDVADPEPLPHETLVRVDAFAPNPGDVAALDTVPPGTIPGWDGSGIVLRAAADGHGPGEGERVLFLGSGGGWAQVRAVPHTTIATADDSPERLATLPVPATSALRAIRRFGSILGRRILVVGAGSAVGAVAVQLAARSGARVVAVARDPAQHRAIRAVGAHETHTSVAAAGARVHGVLDVVGGQPLVDAYQLLEAGGTVISLGHAAGVGEHFPYGAFIGDATMANRSITSFFLGTEPDLAAELGFLAAEARAGRLDVGDVDPRSWTELPEWIASGTPRRSGRVVFRVDHARRTA
ncbi:zinc-binding dehydrogenase [Micromonospora sp. PLK6-60]|uniref:zinc-binding dehydrogenase n=1 Tax=Micromonospora sp. PLK6-60 TaxID=2873383 RepID=UPI001CA68A84|nr:zinc-binding dehydrogenase [Micromonospora sp. PLK6-60]MBY8870539.1 zinc-binding dehydrogenase [Micromonospora sp. PLK6-60]